MVFADRLPRIKPKLIFYGVPSGQIKQRERPLQDPRVTIKLLEIAYNNKKLLQKQLQQELLLSLYSLDSLLVIDLAIFYKIDKVKKLLIINKVILAIIPLGYIGLLQLLDITINKAFKALLREKLKVVLEAETNQDLYS